MLNTMINGESSFVEKKERKVKVPFSSHAVEMVVKYMYGIELEYLENPNALLELIEMGGLNGIENLAGQGSGGDDQATCEKRKCFPNPFICSSLQS